MPTPGIEDVNQEQQRPDQKSGQQAGKKSNVEPEQRQDDPEQSGDGAAQEDAEREAAADEDEEMDDIEDEDIDQLDVTDEDEAQRH